MASTAFSMPRLSSMGFTPATTSLLPSRKIAWASTVAVVVPSPATSEVLLATSFTIWAPMFSNLSSNSISLATVTPSLVIGGGAEALLEDDVAALGPERHANRVGEPVDSREQLCARVLIEANFLGHAWVRSPPLLTTRRGRRPRG